MRKEIIGDAVLYLGDCRDVLPMIGKVDAVVTDPPYGEKTHSNAKSNRVTGTDKKAIDFTSMTSDQLGAVLAECAMHCDRWMVATMEWRHIAAFEKLPPQGWDFVRFGVWMKTNPMPQISADRPAQGWEGIAYLHAASGVKKRWNGGGSHGNYIGAIVTDGAHPTGKPLPLFEQFIQRFTDCGNSVLDPFMGSGTTGVAAMNLKRKFIGIEREEKYFDIACRRIEDAQRQESLF